MRAWLGFLLVIGIGTAAGLQWWNGRSAGPSGLEAARLEAGDGDPAVVVVLDAVGDVVPVVDDEASSSSALAVAPGDERAPPSPDEDARIEVPGGASAESDAESKRQAIALVDQAAKTRNPVEQARLLTRAVRAGALDLAAEEKAYSDLMAANRDGILNPRIDEGCMRTEVRKNDSLWKICKRVEKEARVVATPGLIRLVNGLASDSIYPGTTLKIPTWPVSIVVEKSRFRLSVFLGEVLLKRYSVGVGKNNRTPEGEFSIASRLEDPDWFKPGVGAIPADDPENILGSRWLGFAAKEGFPEAATFGIHGTRDEATIGQESSNGCVRMRNGDVEQLFEWVGEGVTVRIVP